MSEPLPNVSTTTDEQFTLCEIVRSWLKENGYDGLVYGIGCCGCDLNDLMACCDPSGSCEAASKADCSTCRCGPNYDYDCQRNEYESSYMMFAGKCCCGDYVPVEVSDHD